MPGNKRKSEDSQHPERNQNIDVGRNNEMNHMMPPYVSPYGALKKCENLLSSLIRIADEHPTAAAKRVRKLVQGVIDDAMQVEEFTTKLQNELQSAPQPHIVPFLEENLPYLRHYLITKEITIEGIRQPPPSATVPSHPSASNSTHTQEHKSNSTNVPTLEEYIFSPPRMEPLEDFLKNLTEYYEMLTNLKLTEEELFIRYIGDQLDRIKDPSRKRFLMIDLEIVLRGALQEDNDLKNNK